MDRCRWQEMVVEPGSLCKTPLAHIRALLRRFAERCPGPTSSPAHRSPPHCCLPGDSQMEFNANMTICVMRFCIANPGLKTDEVTRLTSKLIVLIMQNPRHPAEDVVISIHRHNLEQSFAGYSELLSTPHFAEKVEMTKVCTLGDGPSAPGARTHGQRELLLWRNRVLSSGQESNAVSGCRKAGILLTNRMCV